jgi:DNA invertase Pin-like site-specific DNA recombinase
MGSITRRKAFSYARISTGAQARGGGIRRQLQDSKEYAEKHGFELVEHLEDVGVSAFKGKNLAPTAALGRFLDAVRGSKVPPGSRLLVESLDRLSRREALKAVSTFIEVLNAGVEITTLMDGKTYTSETTFEELMFSMAAMARAYDESRTKAMRLAAAWRQKREQASTKPMTSWCPSWLRLSHDRDRYEIIEEHARLIRHIFSEAAAGVGSYSIVRRLNERREPHFGRSGVWNISFVSKVLKNPAVLGHFQPHREVDGRRMPDGPVIENYFPAIVDASTFWRVQTGLRERLARGRGRKGHNVANVFPRDMMVCAYCRSPMRFESKSRGKGSFICYAALRGIGCVRARWAYKDFETSALAFIAELDLSSIVNDDSGKGAIVENEISALKGKIAEASEQRDRTFELMQKTTSSTEYVAKRLDEIETARTALEAELEKKEHEHSALTVDRRTLDDVRPVIERLRAPESGGDDSETYRLRSAVASRLRSVVDTILVAPAGASLSTVRPGAEPVVEQGANRRRYFVVVLKNGSFRTVYPHDDDPTKFEQQVVSIKDAGSVQVAYPEVSITVFPSRDIKRR